MGRASHLLVAVVLSVLACSTAGATPVEDLFTAVAIDNLRGTRQLLDSGTVDRHAVDVRGDTPLIVAIRNDATRVIGYLVADPATDLEATNAAGETALMIAAYRKRRDTVEQLIARGAEVNRKGWTALHYAASVDARDIVTILLDQSAYIDADSPNRTTPLMMAARGGFDDLCHQLVDAGADPTLVNERNLTASDFAKRAHDTELADWLTARAVAWRAKYGPVPKRQAAPQSP